MLCILHTVTAGWEGVLLVQPDLLPVGREERGVAGMELGQRSRLQVGERAENFRRDTGRHPMVAISSDVALPAVGGNGAHARLGVRKKNGRLVLRESSHFFR